MLDSIIKGMTEDEKGTAMFIGALVMTINFEKVQPLLIEALANIVGEASDELQANYVQYILGTDDLTENEKVDVLTKIGEIDGH